MQHSSRTKRGRTNSFDVGTSSSTSSGGGGTRGFSPPTLESLCAALGMDEKALNAKSLLMKKVSEKDAVVLGFLEKLSEPTTEIQTWVAEVTFGFGLVLKTLGYSHLPETVKEYLSQRYLSGPECFMAFRRFPTLFCNWEESHAAAAWNRLRDYNDNEYHIEGIYDGLPVKDNNKVIIISGESGAGKTHFCLTQDSSALTVYCPLPASHDPGLPKSDAVAPPSDQVSENTSSELTSEDFIDMIKVNVLNNAGISSGVRISQKTVHLVFDETGGAPVFLRLLCRYGDALIQALESVWQDVRFKLIAVGTGSETITKQPGSSPATYQMIKLGVQPERAGKFLERLTDRLVKECVKELMEHFSVFAALMQNARIASILCTIFKRRFHQDSEAADVLDAAPDIISEATSSYRTANAMSQLRGREEVSKWCRLAVRVCVEQPEELSPFVWNRLVVRYGLVTDNWKIIATDDFDSKKHIKHGPQESERETIILPIETPTRFTMSDAVSLVVTNRLGLPVALSSSTSGDPMEKTVLSKLMLLLACGCSAKVASPYLGLSSENTSPSPLGPVEYVRISRRLSRGNRNPKGIVSSWYPDHVKQLINGKIKRLVQGNKTAIIQNVPGAPYADILVVALGLLWLVQVKDYSSLNIPNFEQERDKMLVEESKTQESTITKELSKIAGVEPRVLFFVRMDPDAATIPEEAKGGDQISDMEYQRSLAQALAQKTAVIMTTDEKQPFLPPMCWPLPFVESQPFLQIPQNETISIDTSSEN